MTLLMTATGRPGALKLSTPSGRTTASFSLRILTDCSAAGMTMEIGSVPGGAAAFTPPGPAPRPPLPPPRPGPPPPAGEQLGGRRNPVLDARARQQGVVCGEHADGG